MAYCAYLRKSRADAEAEAKGAGETLARHEAELLKLAEKLNLNLTAIYKEIVSGETIASRPKMQQLLTEIEAGIWDGVLVVEITRLARGDTIDQGIVAQAFKYSNTKIITPTKIYDPSNEFDEEYFEFGLFMSRREYKMINQRQQRGRIAASKEGKFVGNKPPYGYRRIKLDKQKGWSLEADENAPNVQLIFNMFTQEGLGVTKICNKLNDLHIPSATGKQWIEATVRPLLKNPVYAGWIRWGNRAVQKTSVEGAIKITRPHNTPDKTILAPGLHKPLITQEQFDKAQEIFASQRTTKERNDYTLKNPLAGVIFCAVCGKPMTRRPPTTPGLPTMLMCHTHNCPTVGSVLERVENEVLTALRNWLNNYNITSSTTQMPVIDISPLENSLTATQKELEATKMQMNRIYQLLEQDIYSVEVFLERQADINKRQSEIQAQIDNLQAEIQKKKELVQTRETLIPQIEHVLDAYPLAETVTEKNQLLKSVISRVEYSKTIKQTRAKNDDKLCLTLFPKDAKR